MEQPKTCKHLFKNSGLEICELKKINSFLQCNISSVMLILLCTCLLCMHKIYLFILRKCILLSLFTHWHFGIPCWNEIRRCRWMHTQ